MLIRLGIVLTAGLLFFAGGASAQQKHKFFFAPPSGSTKFTQTHVIDVGDLPGHQMRLAEAQATYGGEAPVLDGVKVREIRGVLVSDYVAGTGNAFLHRVWSLENGDKVYSRMDIMARTTVGADGGRSTSFTGVETLNGGTGKFKGLRGTLFTTGFSDLKTKTSGTQTEGEYWFEQ